MSRLVEAAGIVGLAADIADTVGDWLPALLAAYVTPPRPPAQVRERVLQVAVLGGGRAIGGSCVLITAGDTRLLIDAGTRPTGRSIAEMAPERIDRAVAGPLHGIVVTHAHNDHAGWVPALLVDQPGIPVFATGATAAFLATMWLDSAKVLARRSDENDAAEASPAPYLREDVKHALEQVREVPFGTRTRIGDVEVELFPAGHIIGGAGVVVHAYGRRVVVSGDVSRPGQSTVGGIEVPESAKGADLLLRDEGEGENQESSLCRS
ncbi:MBL fold metallo-hydrolase [Actinophytocola gossypii]|uniref:MBL fold metallo-hydrolase n=1 Tax=Actinophytocola gossypii TaxID=2812003 RepID=A0ABT2JJ59_9PSEU|nr:MBL fold metallo-hydrolase [Actinophytocola gossypii]MCT2587918.1 MBL fold metallo-hydrolase [Actinophytocola gossypii]